MELTPTEVVVSRMWEELLHVPVRGGEADFFALGGESLALVQFLARVVESYGVELPIEVLFAEDLTVAAAARAIDEGMFASVGADELDDLLAEVDRLSEEELRELLAGGA